MNVSQAKAAPLDARAVCLLVAQAFHNVQAQGLDDAGDWAEALGVEFQQLVYQALDVKVGANTESGYFLLPQVQPREWANGVSGS